MIFIEFAKLEMKDFIKYMLYTVRNDHLHVQEIKSHLEHSYCDDSPWHYLLITLHMFVIQVLKQA
jgi:hypothetical protein